MILISTIINLKKEETIDHDAFPTLYLITGCGEFKILENNLE